MISERIPYRRFRKTILGCVMVCSLTWGTAMAASSGVEEIDPREGDGLRAVQAALPLAKRRHSDLDRYEISVERHNGLLVVSFRDSALPKDMLGGGGLEVEIDPHDFSVRRYYRAR